MSFRLVSVSLIVLGLALAAAEARRGFSSGGSGSGAYDGAASTSSWDLSATPDADCIAVFGQSCSALTVAQKEEVAAKTASAQAANYTNHSDYETASAKGYTLSAADGTQWTNAKSPGARGSDTTTNAQWDTDCDNSFSSSGGCDGLTKSQFATIDSSSTGRAPALTAGYSSYDDWQSASALNYEMSADDATLWGEANDGSVSSASCDAEFAGKACNELNKANFQNAKDSNALMTAKIAEVTAGTLSNQDLTDLSISFASSSLSSPLSAWQLDYLETVLGKTSSTTKANWQSTIDNYSASAASKWYVYKIATSSDTSGTYATSNATSALLDACGLTVSTANSALGPATNAQISSHIRHANSDLTSLTGAPTDTQLNDFLTEAVGYANGTSYSDFSTATTSNGWSAADYKTASNSTGWTNSSSDATKFSSCKTNTSTSTGGAGSCSATSSGWDAIQAAITAASDSSTPISSSNITALLTSSGTTAHTYFDASNSVMTDYVNDCISGASDAGAAVSSCVSSGTNAVFKKKVNAFRVAKVVASNSGSYTTSTLTSQILIDAGVTSGNKTYMDASYCGTAGTSSCLAKLRTKLAASNLTTASTQAQVVAKINELMEDVFEDSANSASIPAPSSSPSVGCSTSTNLTLPWICSYSAYTCSKQAGPSQWTMNSSNNLLVIPANYTGTGTKAVTIRATLNYSGSGYYKDYQRSYNVGQAVAASTQGYKWFTQGSTENPHDVKNQCSGKGGVWMTYDEVTSSPLSHPSKAFYSTGSAPCNSHACWYGNSSSNIGFKQGSTIGVQKWSGNWWVGGTNQNATTTHYACKNLPVCN